MTGRNERSWVAALAVATLLLVGPVALATHFPGTAPGTASITAEGVVVDRDTPTETGLASDGVDATEREAFENDVGQQSALLMDADRLHESGLTGEGVRVGVVGSGFDTDHPAIATHVGSYRRLDGGFAVDRASRHDTAVAEIVAEMAPESELYLVGVGTTPTPERYATAVEWLVENDVDIVVDSGSYFPSVAGDGERIADAATAATDEGVVFVTSAGNYAERHWAGNGTDSEWLAFASDDQTNALAGGEQFGGAVSLRLRWNSTADYDLYLYRHLPDSTDRVVAKSVTREASPGLSVEAVDVAVPRGTYYAAVYAVEGANESDRVQLFSARHNLTHATPHGSMVAPATGEHVIAVGAVGLDGRRSFSSVGDDPGDVDVGAPGAFRTESAGLFSGTSAAAPYVAGTAALMHSQNVSLSPANIELILEQTAHSENRSVDPVAAVRAAVARDVTGANVTAILANETDGNLTTILTNGTDGNLTAVLANETTGNATATAPVDESGQSGNETDSGPSANETDSGPSANQTADGSPSTDDGATSDDPGDDAPASPPTDEGEAGDGDAAEASDAEGTS